MAEPQEDIIIIEDSEMENIDDTSETNEPNDNDSKKKKLIIFGGLAVAVVLIVIIILLLIFKSSPHEKSSSLNNIEEKLSKNKIVPIPPSKLENMIAKANYLYSSGSKKEALLLYEKIAIHSEAISLYNLGVAQLKNKQYKVALSTFKKAIKNNDKRCVSAINAAVCSLHLNDEKSFDYYINLAYAYLPHERQSPLYSYYYALINYYKNNYLSALIALRKPTSSEYPTTQKHLKAKIDALFGNNYKAIESMEKDFESDDDFNIALLYARIGDYPLAIKHFEEALLTNTQPIKSQLALGLVKLKAGHISAGAKDIKEISEKFPQDVYGHYPIHVKLKDSIFNSKKAQKHYRNSVEESKSITYQKIFYFAPYKVFNANQTISYIRKGNANIYIDDVKSAQNYLEQSASSSSVNYGIAQSIKQALNFEIRDANTKLKKLVKLQPKHSILQYDLALTYAQMGDMINAQKHFIRSYHLDSKNYLSGIFALMTSQLTDIKTTKLKSIIKDYIADEEPSEEKELYQTLLSIVDNDYISAIEWLDNDYKEKPLYLTLSTIIAQRLGKNQRAQQTSKKLTYILPHDILPHLMYIDAKLYDASKDEYAKKTLTYLKKQKFTFQDLYYGPYVSRYLYTQEKLITGELYFLREQLKDKLETTTKKPQEIIATLALASLYDKQFEESYTLYNSLIDDYKIRDANTLFLGAVASTAAEHHANAIALLELSKMKNKKYLESRYALGLLYMEVNNNDGAVIELSKFKKDGFKSEYFDFEIDTNKLLFKKQHKK